MSNYNKNVNSSTGTEGGDSRPGSEAVLAQPLEVKVFGNFDKALRAFRALVQKERILSTYKEKQSYEKPSQKRRRKKNEAIRKKLELAQENIKGDE